MYEWDEQKRQRNIEKHGIDFLAVVEIFDMPHLTCPADFDDEERFITIGLYQQRELAVIWTERGQNKRIISIRRARHAERQAYRDILG